MGDEFDYTSKAMEAKWDGYAEMEEKSYEAFIERSHKKENFPVHEIIKTIKEKARLEPKEAAILDLGCGMGHFLRAFQDHGFSRLCGVENNPKMFARARELYPGITWVHGNALDLTNLLPSGFQSLVLVYVSGVLSHVKHEDKERFIAAIASHTKFFAYFEEEKKETETKEMYGFRFYYADYTPICEKHFKEIWSARFLGEWGTMVGKLFQKI